MIVPDMLRLNAAKYPNEVALVEINPANQPDPNLTWHEFSLIESTPGESFRREAAGVMTPSAAVSSADVPVVQTAVSAARVAVSSCP